jgi:hypothetical protein
MDFDWQLTIVIVLTVAAALYAGRSFVGQFRRSEDESEGCARCPAARAVAPSGDSSRPAAGHDASPSDR